MSNSTTVRSKTPVVTYKINDTGIGDFTVSVMSNGTFKDDLRNRYGNRRFFSTRGSARKAIWRLINGVSR